MKLVAFCGYMGSGKSFCADYLVKNFGYTKVKFATPLKDMLRALGLTERELEGDLKDKPCAFLNGATPRWAMQTLGTEWGRTLIHENLWGDLWQSEVERLLKDQTRVVVDDCRFLNEVERIKSLGGTLVLIKRPGMEGGDHSSESIPSAPDLTLFNNQNERALEMQLQYVWGLSGVFDKKPEATTK